MSKDYISLFFLKLSSKVFKSKLPRKLLHFSQNFNNFVPMKPVFLVKHSKGALGLRFFGLGPNFIPTNGLLKLQQFLHRNAFWAKDRTIEDLKKCLANSDVIVSIWSHNQLVGFGRALSDGIYRGVLWDVAIDQNHQGKGYGKMIVKSILESKRIKHTKKVYLMTSSKKLFYSQVDFKEVNSQSLLVREIEITP